VRDNLDPRTDDVNTRSCRTLGRFALYMHDYGLDKFDEAFRGDVACWNASAASPAALLAACSNSSVNRAYTWWCNKRPGNPCVFNCPNQVRERGGLWGGYRGWKGYQPVAQGWWRRGPSYLRGGGVGVGLGGVGFRAVGFKPPAAHMHGM
jgi:hypothetical protein